MFAAGVAPSLLWRIALGLGAVPAAMLLALRVGLPETAIWLIQKGRFRQAKEVTRKMYGDGRVCSPGSHPGRRRWSSPRSPSTLPILFVLLGVSSILGTNFLTLGLYCVAIVSGLVGRQIVHRIGQRRLSIYGFGIVLVSLLAAGLAISMNLLFLVPVAAAAMLWGQYWDAENVMTIPSMVAAPSFIEAWHPGLATSTTSCPGSSASSCSRPSSPQSGRRTQPS